MDDVSSLAAFGGSRSQLSPEQARAAILQVLMAVQRGSVISYGRAATRAGLPGRARLVARVLSQLPDDSGVPWHRVLRAGNCIAFSPDSADFERQRRLLLAEGCSVSDKGKVQAAIDVMSDLDESIWGGLFPD